MSVACNSSPRAKEAKYLQKGEALLKKKDYARALLEFKNAAAAMPKDAEPYYQIATAYLASGNLSEGVVALRKATAINPQHEKSQVKLAELMMTSRDKEMLQEAAGRLEAVLSTSPDNFDATDALGFAEWKLGKTADAIARLEATLQKCPPRLQTSVALARLKLSQQDLAGAEQVLQRAAASDPQSSAAQLALGQLHMLAKEPAKAEAELRKAIQLDPKNGAAWMGLAVIQAAGSRMEEAEQTYRHMASLPVPEFKPLYALFLYKVGKLDAALAEFERLARQDPADHTARNRLFAAYEAMGRNQAAQAVLDSALKLNPKDTDALYQRASLSLRAGRISSAEADIKEVLHVRPDFAEAHVVLANIYKAQKLSSSARQELSEALRLKPALLRARLELARSLTLINQASSALDLLNKTPANQSNSPAVIIERNWALLRSGETRQVRTILDRALAIRRFPELVIQDAMLRMQQNDYTGAAADAEEILKNNPAEIRGARLLAECYIAQKQPRKAEERLRALAAANPRSTELAMLLGQWYLNTNNLPAARKAFEAALSVNPAFETAQLALAEVDSREQHPDAARRRLLGIVEANPKDIPALLLLGALAGNAGNQEEALSRYRTVVSIDPFNVAALNNLAFSLASSEPDEALKYAQQAAELAPQNAAIQDTLGWVYYRKAVYATAVSYLETAVAKEPTPRRQFHLAMCYLKSGRRELGEKILQLALRQDPTLPQVEKAW